MIYNLNVLPKDWEMTPFVHDYDNLVEAFVNNGYREGVDLFVWNYDWRKNILEIQNNLNNFIVQKTGPEDKFVLIGHSLGGLVARDWVQYHMDPRLLKLITLGSPHSGVVSAYEAWAGGKVIDYDKFSLQSLMTNLLFQTWRIKYSSDIETVRTVMPVLKDISPTFDFVKKNGQQLPLASLTYKNDYIIGRNLEVSNIFPFLSARVASGAETKSRVLLSEQDLVDKVLNKWGDGSFDGYEYADGDGTILTTSAKISGDSFIQLQATHRKMVDLSVNNIMNELQLRPLAILKQNEDPTENGAVFFIGSPAYLEVDCTGYLTKTSDKFGFVSFPILKNDDKCKLKVVGTGNGAFHVFASYHDSPNVWEKYEGTISKGQVINLSYRVIGNSLVLDQESNNQLWEIIKLKLKNLHKTYLGDNNLDQAYKAAEKKNWLQTLRWTYEFSNKSKEKAVSWSILEDLYHLTPDVLPISQSAAKAYLVVGKAHVKKIYTWLLHHKLDMYEKQEIELASNWGREIDNLYKSGDFASLWKRVKMLEVVVAGLGPATFPM